MFLLLIPVFLFSLLGLMAFGGLANLLYFAVGSVAAGNPGASFNPEFFLEGVVVAVPMACITALLIAMLFATQRKMRGLFPFIVLSSFIVGIFVFVLPNYFNALIRITEKNPETLRYWDYGSNPTVQKHLSAGHFRTTYQGVYYFMKSTERSGVSGVFYPSENSSVPKKTPVIFKDATFPLIVSQSGLDPIIEQALGMPKFLSRGVDVYLMWLSSCLDNISRTNAFFLQMIVFAVPLCLLCLLLNFSSWKLGSAIFIFVSFMAIITANVVVHILEDFCFTRGYFDDNTMFIANSNFVWSIFVNAIISLILMVLKVWNIFYRRNSEKYR